MKEKLELSTLDGLRRRIENLNNRALFSAQEAQTVYDQSPFHTQGSKRTERFWTTTVPYSPDDQAVVLLLESWGGESAYFWQSNETLKTKLKAIGKPRIVEVETNLRGELDAYSAAKTAVQAWARSLGVNVSVLGADLAITENIGSARVLQVHTEGDGVFNKIGTDYPGNCWLLSGI